MCRNESLYVILSLLPSRLDPLQVILILIPSPTWLLVVVVFADVVVLELLLLICLDLLLLLLCSIVSSIRALYICNCLQQRPQLSQLVM